MSDATIFKMPPRNDKQALIAQLRVFIDQAERDQIASLAVVICRPCETPENPPQSYYRWRENLTLSGASAMLTKLILEDHGDDADDRWT
jgi:hypothetical protein